MLMLVQRQEKVDHEQIAKWLDETSLDKLPVEDVRKALAPYRSVFSGVEIAARRDRCDWDLPIREIGTDLFGMLLPEIQEARTIGRLLALRARLQLAEGNTEEALATVRTIFAFSRHIAEQPFLISGLVGTAMANVGLRELELIVQAKDAPNLYWPLTDLPDPLVSLRDGIDLEYEAPYLVLPELSDARTGDFGKDEWERRAARLRERLGPLVRFEGSQDAEQWKAFLDKDLVKTEYESAKARLLERGQERETIEAMPAGRVVLLDAAECFAEIRDEIYKGFSLPYPDAQKVFEASDGVLARANEMGVGGRLAGLLLPAINSVNRATARTQRNVDALRIVEAIRLHAAKHGKLPDSLEAITEVPIPMNALIGKPFGYRVEDGVATLECDGPDSAKRYRIRLAK
jgi:hypothetical protein